MQPNLQTAVEKILQESDSTFSIGAPGASVNIDLEGQIKALVNKHSQTLSSTEKERLEREFLSFGPIDELIHQPDITEILINDLNNIWFEKHGYLQRHTDLFLSEITFENSLRRLCHSFNSETNLQNPFLNGNWQDFRVHVVHDCITHQAKSLSLRRHPQNPWTLSSLKENHWCSPEQEAYLQDLIKNKKNFVVVGQTGSGKTSVASALLALIPANERTVIIEDVRELSLPNAASIRLLTRHDPTGSLSDVCQSRLLKESLRMRPERIVVGEVRGGEAKDLLMALSTGHRGSFGTLHAESPHQALMRLELLVQMGAPQWSLHTVRSLIHQGLDYIVCCRKSTDGKRFLGGLYKIASLEERGYLIDTIFETAYSAESESKPEDLTELGSASSNRSTEDSDKKSKEGWLLGSAVASGFAKNFREMSSTMRT